METIEGSDHMPLIPAPRWQSELRADIKKHKLFKNSYVRVGMDWTFAQDRPFFAFNTESTTPAYTLWNAGVGTDITNAKGHTLFSIHFAGLNLTDAVYQNHLSRLKYTDVNQVNGRMGVFNAGRNFSLKINIPILITL